MLQSLATLVSTVRPGLPTKVPEGLSVQEAMVELKRECADYFLGQVILR